MKNVQVVEINGIKMEVDLRHAKRVDTYKVGDRVKVMVKSYGNTCNVYHGAIVGFENFDSLPTIVVAYIKAEYNSADLEIVYLNALTTTDSEKKVEIVPDLDETLPINKADVLGTFDKRIDKLNEEIRDIERKKHFFLTRFQKAFGEWDTENS